MESPSNKTLNKHHLYRNSAGKAIRGVLAHARAERRLTCGLLPAIGLLENDPCSVLFCVMAESRPGDATSHMHTVLLQAFCYENDIPVIQVSFFYCRNFLQLLFYFSGYFITYGRVTETKYM